jgi:hypothetical protein
MSRAATGEMCTTTAADMSATTTAASADMSSTTAAASTALSRVGRA